MSKYLILNLIGKDQPGIINSLSALISEVGCSIITSRMNSMGKNVAGTILLQGKWNNLAKFEAQINQWAKQKEMIVSHCRTDEHNYSQPHIPYNVQVIAMDSVGIINQITDFFSDENINIVEMNIDSYDASITKLSMVSVNMIITVDAEIAISDLRERFMIFCDDLNLDAILEPIKP